MNKYSFIGLNLLVLTLSLSGMEGNNYLSKFDQFKDSIKSLSGTDQEEVNRFLTVAINNGIQGDHAELYEVDNGLMLHQVVGKGWLRVIRYSNSTYSIDSVEQDFGVCQIGRRFKQPSIFEEAAFNHPQSQGKKLLIQRTFAQQAVQDQAVAERIAAAQERAALAEARAAVRVEEAKAREVAAKERTAQKAESYASRPTTLPGEPATLAAAAFAEADVTSFLSLLPPDIRGITKEAGVMTIQDYINIPEVTAKLKDAVATGMINLRLDQIAKVAKVERHPNTSVDVKTSWVMKVGPNYKIVCTNNGISVSCGIPDLLAGTTYQLTDN